MWLGMLLSGAIFYLYQFVLRSSQGVLSQELMGYFSIGANHLTLLTSAYYASYSLSQIPIGMALDRLGPRWVMRTGIILCTCGSFLVAISSNFSLAIVGRLLIGAGGATSLLGTIRLATLWAPSRHLAMAVGSVIALGKCAGLIVGFALVHALHCAGLSHLLMGLAFIGIIVGILVFISVKNKAVLETPQLSWCSVLTSVRTLLKRPSIWILGLYASFMYAPLIGIVESWGTDFITNSHEISRLESAYIITCLSLGAVVGTPLFAALSDFFQSRRRPMQISALCAAGLMPVFLLAPLSPLQTCWVLAALGIAISGQSLVFTLTTEVTPSENSGVAVSLVNMMIMVIGGFIVRFSGIILEKYTWDGTWLGGIPFYSASGYRWALAPLAIGLTLSAILSFWLPSSPCESSQASTAPKI